MRDEQPVEPDEDDGKQNPLVHEPGGASTTHDTNETADAKVEIQQPSGETISPAGEDAP